MVYVVCRWAWWCLDSNESGTWGMGLVALRESGVGAMTFGEWVGLKQWLVFRRRDSKVKWDWRRGLREVRQGKYSKWKSDRNIIEVFGTINLKIQFFKRKKKVKTRNNSYTEIWSWVLRVEGKVYYQLFQDVMLSIK